MGLTRSAKAPVTLAPIPPYPLSPPKNCWRCFLACGVLTELFARLFTHATPAFKTTDLPFTGGEHRARLRE